MLWNMSGAKSSGAKACFLRRLTAYKQDEVSKAAVGFPGYVKQSNFGFFSGFGPH